MPGTAEGSKRDKKKGPSVNEKPQLRQHSAPFFDNFVTKGIAHELSRRSQDDPVDPNAEINHRKEFTIGAPNVEPPFHVLGDDERVRDGGALRRVQRRLTEELHAEDRNRDGMVSQEEFVAAVRRVADRHLPPKAVSDLFKLVPGASDGKVGIDDAVAVSVRQLATKPSQRGTLGSGNVLAWNDEADTRDPSSVRAAVCGGARDPRKYYGLSGFESVTSSPVREARLPGLSPRVAGVSTSSKLKEVDKAGGTAAPLSRAPAAKRRLPSAQPVSKRGNGSGQLPSALPQPSPPTSARTSQTRAQALRSQYREHQQQLEEAIEAGYFPIAKAMYPRFSSPRGASHAPRPGIHIVHSPRAE